MKGLRIKPTYEQLIGVAVSDDLGHLRFPNRNASFFKKWFYSVTIRWGRVEANGKTARNCQ